MKVNVLGTEYKIVTDNSISSNGVDGLCKCYDKEIVIRSEDEMLSSEDGEAIKKIRYKEVLRHELIHAFLFEAGLDDYCNDEKLVNWIAMQFPKMVGAFIKAECLDFGVSKIEIPSIPPLDMPKITPEMFIPVCSTGKKREKGGATC